MENNEKKKIYQNTWFIVSVFAALILVVVAVASISGGDKPVVTNEEGTTVESEKQPTKVSVEEQREEEVGKEVSEVLKDERIVDVSVVSEDESGKPEVFLQLKIDGEKANIESSNVETEVNSIIEKVQDIASGFQMEIVDSNMELIALYYDGSLEFKE